MIKEDKMNREKPFLWIARIDYGDPETEAEWNTFYSSVHLQEILSLPGTIRVSRYECIRGRKKNPKYLSITEISGEDNIEKFSTSPEAIAVAKGFEERYPKTLGVSVAGYRHIITVEKSKGGI
jgi:hypothetical protein